MKQQKQQRIKLYTILSLLMISSFTACNKKEPSPERPIVKFGKDRSTLSKADEQLRFSEMTDDEIAEYREEQDRQYEDSAHVSEIVLENFDNTTDYTVDGADIIYNNRRFIGLNACLDRIEYPSTRETMINFLIKSFDDGTEDVECFCMSDRDYINEDEAGSVPLSYSLAELEGYTDLASVYGEDAYWSLELSTSQTRGIIYGCSKYILLRDKDGLIVNMEDLRNFRVGTTSTNESMTDGASEEDAGESMTEGASEIPDESTEGVSITDSESIDEDTNESAVEPTEVVSD